MKFLSPRIHGTIDYLFVALFLLAPAIFGFGGLPATLATVIAITHLTLSLCTAYPVGLLKAFALPAHGWLELLAGTGIMLSPWLFSFSEIASARIFFLVSGISLLVTWLVSDYQEDRIPTSLRGDRE